MEIEANNKCESIWNCLSNENNSNLWMNYNEACRLNI